jgi:hypothetical protein
MALYVCQHFAAWDIGDVAIQSCMTAATPVCNQPHPAPSLRAYSLQTTQLPRHHYLRALIKTSGSTRFSHLLSMFSTQPYHQHNCNYSLIIMYGPSRLGGARLLLLLVCAELACIRPVLIRMYVGRGSCWHQICRQSGDN